MAAVLVFGPETRGLPAEILAEFLPENRLRLPMQAGQRSLNLSNAVAVTVAQGRADWGVAIETVASGGGSICGFDGGRMFVGPQSAGAQPGPACYGRGGPLAITDINFFLGRILPDCFPFPLQREPVVEHLRAIAQLLEQLLVEILLGRYAGDENAGGGRNDQCWHLRDKTVADREQRVILRRLRDIEAMLQHADRQAADHVDQHDGKYSD